MTGQNIKAVKVVDEGVKTNKEKTTTKTEKQPKKEAVKKEVKKELKKTSQKTTTANPNGTTTTTNQ